MQVHVTGIVSPFFEEQVNHHLRVLNRAKHVENAIEILDRLLEHGGISEDEYVKKLKDIYPNLA